MKENDLLLLYACVRWNAKALAERNRGETISNFKAWRMQKWLLFDPTEYSEATVNLNDNQREFGISIGSTSDKLTGLTLLKDFLYEVVIGGDILDDGNYSDSTKLRLHEIPSLAFLLELQRFGDGNFDRISTAIVAMFEFKKDDFVKRKNLFTPVNSKETNAKTLYQKLIKT